MYESSNDPPIPEGDGYGSGGFRRAHAAPEGGAFTFSGRSPGAEVVADLERLELPRCSDAEVVEVIKAWQAVESRAKARLWEAVTEFMRRRPREGRGEDPGAPWDRDVSGFATAEVAAALNLPLSAADNLAAEAAEVQQQYPALVESLGEGRVNPSRFYTVVRGLRGVDDKVAQAVLEAVLPDAEGPVSNGTLRSRLRRAVMRADPEAAVRRCEEAARRDTALVLHPREDAMASLVATAPAVDLVAVHTAVDAFAKALADAGAPGALAKLRVRSLQELVLTHPAITGLGPWQRALGLPVTGDTSRTGGGAPAGRERGQATGGVGSTADDAVGGVDDEGRLQLGLPLSEIPTFGCGSAGRFSSLTMVAIPYDVLLGVSEAPGELVGYGPLPAPVARAIAGDQTGTWQRLVTDPLSGSVQDFGTTRYRPPAKLAGHVVTRDWTCRAPGCSAPAVVCDLDHATPYRHDGTGGATCAANLIPLCRRHHRCKTFTGWTVRREPDGRVVWRTPTGHEYVTYPDGPVQDWAAQD